MTTPVDLRALNEGHRARQAQNAANTQRLVAQLFLQMIEPGNITGTAQRWLNQAVLAVVRGRQASWTLAIAYATAIRRLQVPDAPPMVLPDPEPPNREKITRSLIYTGPGKLAVDLAKLPRPTEFPEDPTGEPPSREQVERAQRTQEVYAERLAERLQVAAVTSSAAAYRHVADGGRDAVHHVIAHDRVAVGYIRITKDAPCAFCLMLASRGPVYSEDSFERSDPRFEGEGEHKVHDSCGCSLQPIFGGRSTRHWTEQARMAEQLWIAHGAPRSGAAARNAFARAAREAGVADLTRW